MFDQKLLCVLAGDQAARRYRAEANGNFCHLGMVCIHEAGHAVLYILSGSLPWQISIKHDARSFNGLCLPDFNSPAGSEDSEMVSSRISVLREAGAAIDITAHSTEAARLLDLHWPLVQRIANSLFSRCGGAGNWSAEVTRSEIRKHWEFHNGGI